MDIKTEGNPGTGNSFHEYHINHVETNATTLTFALEGDKDHSVRGELRKLPADTEICDRVKALLTRNS